MFTLYLFSTWQRTGRGRSLFLPVFTAINPAAKIPLHAFMDLSFYFIWVSLGVITDGFIVGEHAGLKYFCFLTPYWRLLRELHLWGFCRKLPSCLLSWLCSCRPTSSPAFSVTSASDLEPSSKCVAAPRYPNWHFPNGMGCDASVCKVIYCLLWCHV